jgi:two-component system chemotaxis sensor kinase CheA
VAHTEDIPALESVDPEACYTSWDAILTTSRGMNAIQDIFIFVKENCDLDVTIIDEEGSLADEASYKKLGQILLERGDLTPEDLQKALARKKMVGEVLVETGVVPPAKIESALAEQKHVREQREQRQGVDEPDDQYVAHGIPPGLVSRYTAAMASPRAAASPC